MPLVLGPFRLDVPIARGGMSEVWRGTHDISGALVAVKLLPRGMDDRLGRASLEAEVRAVARLDHPGIIRVVDHGLVDRQLASASRGRIVEGAPWIAMEHASGGALSQLGTLPDWRTLRGVLLSILDALAHAHARGLVHRDLKPGNVLLCAGTDDRPGLKLTDFGIAHVIGSSPEHGVTAGTLQYMAPEQVRGSAGRIGPWTDLYGLGCLAWTLVTGSTVFADAGDGVREAHLDQSPPGLDARFEVPAGFELWLRCLLAKDPADRFKRAAEAAAALLSLGNATGAVGSVAHSPAAVAASLEELLRPGTEIVVAQPTTLAVELLGPGLGGARATWRPTAIVPGSGAIPEVPVTWRHPVPPPPPRRLSGAGLGLLGFREHRVLGRDAECDRCWTAVREVAGTRENQVILLRGTAGSGRSRLANAVAERTHELALAEVFSARIDPWQRGIEALWLHLKRRLGLLEGLAGEAERVARSIRGHTRDAEVLTERWCGRRGAAGEEIGALTRTLVTLAEGRVALVLLDEVQGDLDALDWLAAVLERPDLQGSGLLVIGTVRDDLTVSPDVEERIARLAGHPRCVGLPLGPLDRGSLLELVRDLLGLEASAAGRVVDAAGGNPGFAVSVVREWAARGLFAPGPHGFALEPGTDVELPGDLAEALLGRAREAMQELPPAAWVVLERAAVLGDPVRRDEWEAACGNEVLVPRGVVEELFAARLAEPDVGGWRFASATLREALVGGAGRAGRLEEHHRACAEALDMRDGVDPGRIGLHLLGAGDPEAALEPLLRSLEEAGDQYRGLDRAARIEVCLERAGVPTSDPRWGKAWVRRAGLCMRAGRYAEAEAWSERALEAATHHGWSKVAAGAAFERAVVALHQHAWDGQDRADRALEAARTGGDERDIARAGYLRAAAAADKRDWDLADARYAAVIESCRSSGDRSGEADCHRDLGNMALFRGDLEVAEAHYREALALFQAVGAPLGEAHGHNGLAEVARKRGQLEEAEAGYLRALECFDRVGAGQAMLARLNLGQVRVARGEWRSAREILERTRAWLDEQGRTTWVAAAGSVLLPVYLALGDREAFDRAVEEVETSLLATGFAQPDVLAAAERARQIAEAAGDVERASAVGRIVRSQRERLERR